MAKTVAWFIAAILGAGACQATGLTPDEERWLKGAWPVLMFARDAGLPLDIVVQPQPTPGVPPIALAYIDGRCKFVFSMRDNPDAQGTVERIAPELFDVTLELMAAHELAHCQRHVSGAWYGLPPGRVPRAFDGPDEVTRAAYEDMQAVRREEGYADLVGLAWTQQHHASLYPRLQSWLLAERSVGRVPGSHHDTLAWVRLATCTACFAGESIFDAAKALWVDGLDAEP
jgi:hypothetical protein